MPANIAIPYSVAAKVFSLLQAFVVEGGVFYSHMHLGDRGRRDTFRASPTCTKHASVSATYSGCSPEIGVASSLALKSGNHVGFHFSTTLGKRCIMAF